MQPYQSGRPSRNKDVALSGRPTNRREDRRSHARRRSDAPAARRRSRGGHRSQGQRRSAPRGWHGQLGVASARVLARDPISATRWRAFLCVIHGPTAGRQWDSSAARKQLRVTAPVAGVRRRLRPPRGRNPTRYPLLDAVHGILGNVAISPAYPTRQPRDHLDLLLQGIDSSEIIETVHARSTPVISATAGLRPNPS